ncbi:MAG: hypothetical protein WC055_10125 [Melioribacteraceae bacterium]
MKLYKFRNLENYSRIEDILRNKEFYLSKWNALNDPMEGYFEYIRYNSSVSLKDKIQRFINEKK